jgi:hypothetical protein
MGLSKKEIAEFREILRKQREEVANSKEAAEALLKSVGILTPSGRISKRFKGLTRVNVSK